MIELIILPVIFLLILYAKSVRKVNVLNKMLNNNIYIFCNIQCNCNNFLKYIYKCDKCCTHNLIDFTSTKETFNFLSRITNEKSVKIIIHTYGGISWNADSLSLVLSKNKKLYKYIYVPECALSAGSVISLSGNKIFCNWYSIFSPIDSQIFLEDLDMSVSTKYLKDLNNNNDSKMYLNKRLAMSIYKDDYNLLLKIFKNNKNKKQIIDKFLKTENSHDNQILIDDMKKLNLPIVSKIPEDIEDIFTNFKDIFNL